MFLSTAEDPHWIQMDQVMGIYTLLHVHQLKQ